MRNCGVFPPFFVFFVVFAVFAAHFLMLNAMAKKAKSIVTLSFPKCRNRLYAMLNFICPNTASQRLLASPVTRPLIEALDYAQRTNIIGSLRQTDVSRTITAPAVLAQSQAPMVIVQENNALRETLARLNERLNEPFVTVNTVTGDLGIKQAQDDYQRLMNNKSPKNKRR